MRCTAEAVKIDGTSKIRITCGGYILGEVLRVQDVEPLLARHGKTLLDLDIKEGPDEEQFLPFDVLPSSLQLVIRAEVDT